jgi:hypothetical protein
MNDQSSMSTNKSHRNIFRKFGKKFEASLRPSNLHDSSTYASTYSLNDLSSNTTVLLDDISEHDRQSSEPDIHRNHDRV